MSDIPVMMRYLGSDCILRLDLNVPVLQISVLGKVFELRYRSSEHSRRALTRVFSSFRYAHKVITGVLPEGDIYDS